MGPAEVEAIFGCRLLVEDWYADVFVPATEVPEDEMAPSPRTNTRHKAKA